MKGTANTDTGGRFCGRAVQGVSNLSNEDMRQIEAHRCKERPTPWPHLAKRYGVNEVDLRSLFQPKKAEPSEPAPAPVLGWTPERTGRLIQLYVVENRTADETASLLGCSREAVIGKALRMGISKRRAAKAEIDSANGEQIWNTAGSHESVGA